MLLTIKVTLRSKRCNKPGILTMHKDSIAKDEEKRNNIGKLPEKEISGKSACPIKPNRTCACLYLYLSGKEEAVDSDIKRA